MTGKEKKTQHFKVNFEPVWFKGPDVHHMS